jgi:hypothetical protein
VLRATVTPRLASFGGKPFARSSHVTFLTLGLTLTASVDGSVRGIVVVLVDDVGRGLRRMLFSLAGFSRGGEDDSEMVTMFEVSMDCMESSEPGRWNVPESNSKVGTCVHRIWFNSVNGIDSDDDDACEVSNGGSGMCADSSAALVDEPDDSDDSEGEAGGGGGGGDGP